MKKHAIAMAKVAIWAMGVVISWGCGSEKGDRVDQQEQALRSVPMAATIAVTNAWAGGYCASAVLTNTSGGVTSGWSVSLDLHGSSLSSLWNAQGSVVGGRLVATSEPFSAILNPAASTSFGFCASGANASPSLLAVTAWPMDAVSEEVRADLRLSSDWPTGYCADLTIANRSGATTWSWSVVIDLAQSQMTSVWNASASTVGSRLTLLPMAYNAVLAPNASTHVGFCANKTGPRYRPSIIPARPGGVCQAEQVPVCGGLDLSSALRLAPAALGQQYARCDTLGPDQEWQTSLSPDGRRLAARTGAGTLRLIATDDWREVAQIASPLGRIDAVAFSPDCAWMAALSAEMGAVTLWRAEDGALEGSFAGPPASTIDGWASALAFSSDGRRLATSLGTVIDLVTGATIDWHSGVPVNLELTVNPENLWLGEAIPDLRFTSGDQNLFMDVEYRVGNSPASTRLVLRSSAGGEETVVFHHYTRGLRGYALSPDGRLIALARSLEATPPGEAPGLHMFRADNGAEVAADPSFDGRVLGFSPDAALLYGVSGSGEVVEVFNATDLRRLSTFPWNIDTVFLGVSPQGDLVGTNEGTTFWLDPMTGDAMRTFGRTLGNVTWSAGGRYGAATADGALFSMWSEADGAELCAPPQRGAPAPPLSSLGATTPNASGEIVSADGSTSAANVYVVHTHASNWTALHVRDAASGTERRIFGAVRDVRPISVAPDGARLYTPEGPSALAVWCR